MATCLPTGRETWLVEGPSEGTVQCPECGQVMDSETLQEVKR